MKRIQTFTSDKRISYIFDTNPVSVLVAIINTKFHSLILSQSKFDVRKANKIATYLIENMKKIMPTYHFCIQNHILKRNGRTL
jgi:hypothetical protein